MSIDPDELRSSRFRREREGSWLRLEDLLTRKAKAGLNGLSPGELRELPTLYRAALSSLSVARAIALDRSLVLYLESLSRRAYYEVYAPRVRFAEMLGAFLMRDLPRAVRTVSPMIALSALLFLLGAGIGWWLVHEQPDLYSGIVPRSLAGGRTPFSSAEELRASLYDSVLEAATLQEFALFLFRSNASVAVLSFGLGFALGIPTIMLMFYNGAIFGAFFAAFERRDLAFDVIAWLSVHGTTELAALFLASGAGLSLGRAVLFPGPRRSRLASLRDQGRVAGLVALGSLLLLFVAALLEGVVRQVVTDPYARLAIGSSFGLVWLIYFARAGKVTA